MIYKNKFVSLSFIGIGGIAIWLTFFYHFNPVKSEPSDLLPDGFMEDVTSLVLDKQGKPKLKIESPKVLHYARNDISHLVTPTFTLYRNSPQPWFVRSSFAKATDGTDRIDLWEDVSIHHAADSSNPATLIKTTTLTIHPENKTAETPDYITMTQPNLVVKALGMYADMNTGDIKLLAQARGEYVAE